MTGIEIMGAVAVVAIIAAQFIALKIANKALKSGTEKLAKAIRWLDALETIANDEAALKSGTARRLRRIAREAIDG